MPQALRPAAADATAEPLEMRHRKLAEEPAALPESAVVPKGDQGALFYFYRAAFSNFLAIQRRAKLWLQV